MYTDIIRRSYFPAFLSVSFVVAVYLKVRRSLRTRQAEGTGGVARRLSNASTRHGPCRRRSSGVAEGAGVERAAYGEAVRDACRRDQCIGGAAGESEISYCFSIVLSRIQTPSHTSDTCCYPIFETQSHTEHSFALPSSYALHPFQRCMTGRIDLLLGRPALATESFHAACKTLVVTHGERSLFFVDLLRLTNEAERLTQETQEAERAKMA